MLSLFVWILAFSYQDSNHVEVPITSCGPNNAETKLGLGILANIECYFILAVDNVPKFWVLICAPSKKLLNYFRMAVISCIVKW